MSPALEILIGAGGTVAALLAVLLPVIRALGSNLRREIEKQGESLHREIEGQGETLRRELDTLRGDLRADVASLRADVGEVRRDLHALSDRVARIEGTLSGPWRPANGSPAAAPKGGTPEAAE